MPSCIWQASASALPARPALMLAALGQLAALDIAGLVIYSAGMIAMFSVSAGYHLVRRPALKGLAAARRSRRHLRHDRRQLYALRAQQDRRAAPVLWLMLAVWGVALFGVRA